MAGDWIKMRTDLYRDPKVCGIADALLEKEGDLARFVSQHQQRDMSVTRNVMRNAVVGALVAVWGVARQRGKRLGDDLVLKGVTPAVVDDMADVAGFGDAMAAVGWVRQTRNGLVFPRFFEDYNVDPVAEMKAKNAARQRRYREAHSNGKSNVTVAPQSNTEKSRGEKRKKTKPLPEAGEGGGEPPKEPAPRPRNLLFDAVAEVSGADPKLNGGTVGTVAAKLAKCEPPYTPEEVFEFGRRFWEICPWAAKDNRDRPTAGEIGKWIERLRTAPVPRQQKPRGPHYQTQDSRVMSEIVDACGDAP